MKSLEEGHIQTLQTMWMRESLRLGSACPAAAQHVDVSSAGLITISGNTGYQDFKFAACIFCKPSSACQRACTVKMHEATGAVEGKKGVQN